MWLDVIEKLRSKIPLQKNVSILYCPKSIRILNRFTKIRLQKLHIIKGGEDMHIWKI